MGRVVVVEEVRGTTVLSYIDEIKSKGLIMGQDFEWYFLQGDKTLMIQFADEKYTTFYKLKWSSK